MRITKFSLGDPGQRSILAKFLAVLCLLFLFQISYGQDSTANHVNAKRKAVLKRMSRELALDQAQRQQVRTLIRRRSEEVAVAKTLSQEERKARMKVINRRSRNRLKVILTDEQFDQYLSLRAKLKEFRQREYEGREDVTIDEETDF